MNLIQLKDHRMTSKPSKSVKNSIPEMEFRAAYGGNHAGAVVEMEAPGGVEPPTNSLGKRRWKFVLFVFSCLESGPLCLFVVIRPSQPALWQPVWQPVFEESGTC